jgi:hypothetical protein
MLAPAAE